MSQYLLVGLGNPGPQYERTRHNIGFDAIDELAAKYGLSINQQKFSSYLTRGVIHSSKILLAKPQTFMNLSGRSVGQITRYFHIPNENLLVLHDDMDVEMGRLKVVARGGAGGHNGVSSIIAELGSSEFARIKIGIGRPKNDRAPVGHVLAGFDKEEVLILKQVLEGAAGAAETFVAKGVAEAQARYNRRDLTNEGGGKD